MPQLPILDPLIKRIPLAKLASESIPVNATLYLPPVGPRMAIDEELLSRILPEEVALS